MNPQEVEQAIRNYLPLVVHMSLGTCANNKPWVCEVHFVYDNELNLYFRSLPSRRHSQEIAQNPNVAGNIVVQHQLGQKPRGVYFEGTAEKLAKVDENHVAYQECHKRFGLGPEILEDAKTDAGHGFYKITVSDFYLFDTLQSKPSQKYHLSWPR
ncbi:MAG TPA: pyridoxamine 5'-phosphate oxidase family protein [Nevskiaceae bacterium]|nr:pyridoxamine 5'-phosphate oxidase family protein [Nevskiaceae bacterium]